MKFLFAYEEERLGLDRRQYVVVRAVEPSPKASRSKFLIKLPSAGGCWALEANCNPTATEKSSLCMQMNDEYSYQCAQRGRLLCDGSIDRVKCQRVTGIGFRLVFCWP